MKPDDRLDAARRLIGEVQLDYLALHAALAVSMENRTDDRHGSGAAPAVPLRIAVFDTIVAIRADVASLEGRLRREVFQLTGPNLRRDTRVGGVGVDARPVAALSWIADAISATFAAGLGDHTEDVLYGLHRRSQRVLGLAERVYPLPHSRCPYCGLPSLLARPDRGLVTCGNPECRDEQGERYVWRVGEHPPVWEATAE